MNEKLRQDVEFLKGKRIIKKDKDIIESTGVNKTALSSYLSGRVNASKPFLDKFYEVYGAELTDNKVYNGTSQNTADLQKEILRLREVIEGKDRIIDAQMKALMMAERLLNSFTRKVATGISPSKRKN